MSTKVDPNGQVIQVDKMWNDGSMIHPSFYHASEFSNPEKFPELLSRLSGELAHSMKECNPLPQFRVDMVRSWMADVWSHINQLQQEARQELAGAWRDLSDVLMDYDDFLDAVQ